MRAGLRSLPLFAGRQRRILPMDLRGGTSQPPPHITAGCLLFAAEDVIYDATIWWRWVVQLLRRIGVHAHYSAVYRIWQRDYRDGVNRGECDLPTAFRRFLLSLGLQPAQVEEIFIASLTRRKQLLEQLRPLPDVPPVLTALRLQGLPLAVVSYACHDLEVFRERLRTSDLTRYFDAVFCATELGHAASDPALFDAIAQRWTGHVGPLAFASFENSELAAAQDAGMVTIGCRSTDESLPGSNTRLIDFGSLPSLFRPTANAHRRAG